MILLWIVAAAATILAAGAWVRIRRQARRLEQLSQMYWELKYQQLQHQQDDLRPQLRQNTGEIPPVRSADKPAPADAFVPLASLKR